MPDGAIPDDVRSRLLANGQALRAGETHLSEVAAVVRLYDVHGNGEWLIAALDPDDPDLAIGLSASGRAGGLLYASFRLSQLAAECERGGRRILRDRYYRAGRSEL